MTQMSHCQIKIHPRMQWSHLTLLTTNPFWPVQKRASGNDDIPGIAVVIIYKSSVGVPWWWEKLSSPQLNTDSAEIDLWRSTACVEESHLQLRTGRGIWHNVSISVSSDISADSLNRAKTRNYTSETSGSTASAIVTPHQLRKWRNYRQNTMFLATRLKVVVFPEDHNFPLCWLFDYNNWRDTLSGSGRMPGNAKKCENRWFCFITPTEPTFSVGQRRSRDSFVLDNDTYQHFLRVGRASFEWRWPIHTRERGYSDSSVDYS